MNKKDNGEMVFKIMCKTAIILIISVIVVGIIAVILSHCTKGSTDWYIPVRTVNVG